jgi:hypothetical protein
VESWGGLANFTAAPESKSLKPQTLGQTSDDRTELNGTEPLTHQILDGTQAAEREDRQRKLREDAARTLGDRAKYFEGKDPRKDGAINRSADAGKEASPPQSGEDSAPSGGGGLYRNRFQEESEKRLRSILPNNSKSSSSPKPASPPASPPPSSSSSSGPGVWETMLTLKEQRGDAKGGSTVGSAGGGNDGGEASNTGGYNLEDLPVIGDEVDEYQNGKTTKWKVIAPDGIVVLAGYVSLFCSPPSPPRNHIQ